MTSLLLRWRPIITNRCSLFCTTVIVSLMLPYYAFAAWSNDPGVNNPICTVAGDQHNLAIASDSSGGAITVWQDKRNGQYDIYAQRLCFCDLVIDWPASSVAICTSAGDQLSPQLVNDNRNGAIIVWQDRRNGTNDIYAQRVNPYGVVSWKSGGVPICTADSSQTNIAAIADNRGGAIIVWQDKRTGNEDIYAQRIDSSGIMKWSMNGLLVCAKPGEQSLPKLVSDANGGAIITWQDKRDYDYDIYAQRISANGTVGWTAGGKRICSTIADQLGPEIAAAGNNGAIIAWADYRNSTDFNIYSQRITGDGVTQWAADGVVMNSNMAKDQLFPKIVSDGSGGAIMSWQDNRAGTASDIYAQRVNDRGQVQWVSTGLPICTNAGIQLYPIITDDAYGGACILWCDFRAGLSNIYAQRVNATGQLRWTKDGMAISTATGGQMNPSLVSDGDGGAIMSWQDSRNSSIDVYAHKVDGANASTTLESAPQHTSQKNVTFLVTRDKVQYSLPEGGAVFLRVRDLFGRDIAVLVNSDQAAGSYSLTTASNNLFRNIPRGIYFFLLDVDQSISIRKLIIKK